MIKYNVVVKYIANNNKFLCLPEIVILLVGTKQFIQKKQNRFDSFTMSIASQDTDDPGGGGELYTIPTCQPHNKVKICQRMHHFPS